MTSSGKFKLIFIFFIFLFANSLSSQHVQEKQFLTEILKELELQHNCSFSYSNDDLEGISIIPPSNDLSLKEVIYYLKSQTVFDYTLLQGNFITIAATNPVYFNICGNIVDVESRQPVIGATVHSNLNYAISEENGSFLIENMVVGDVIEIRHFGYESYFLSLDELPKDCFTIKLSHDLNQLKEVLITNFITQGINKKTDGSVAINYQKFGVLPGLIESDALQTIQSLPGINSIDETVTNINIRGGSHDQNLVLWNNIRMYQTGHFFSLISAFNPNMTQRVFSVKNGTDVELSEGVSGTIKLESSDEVATDFNTTFGINLIEANVLLDVPISKKASFHVSGRRSYIDVANTHTSENFFEKAFQHTEIFKNQQNVLVENDDFNFFDIEAVLNYNISNKNRLKISFITMKNNLSFLESALISGVVETKESRSEQHNLAFGISYHHDWNSKLKSTLEFYGLDYYLKAKNADIPNNRQFTQENNINETQFTFSTIYQINNKLDLKSGYIFNESGIYNLDESNNPLFRKYSKDVLRKHALFSNLQFNTQNNKTQFISGIRFNYIDPLKESLIEPRFSFNQQISNEIAWDILGEIKHQTSTQTIDFQTDFLGVENRRWIASNQDNIPIIKSKQLSTGLTFKKNKWLVNIEGFYKQVNGIVAQSQEFRNQYEFKTDVGNYYGNGVDLFISKRIGILNLWGSYSYQDLNYQFHTLQEADFPNNFNLNQSLNLGTSLTYNKFKIATGLKWHTGKATTDLVMGNEILEGKLNYQSANTGNLPDYFRWDASFMYDFTIKKKINVNTGISLWNITNQKNIINTYFELNDTNLPAVLNENSLEFTSNLMLKINF